MCIQDWQIGRLIRSVVTKKAVSTTESIILARDKDRVAVTFCNDAAQVIGVCPQINQTNGLGFLIAGQGGTSAVTGTGTISGSIAAGAIALTAANPLVSSDYTGTVGPETVSLETAFSSDAVSSVLNNWLHVTNKDWGDLPSQKWSAQSFAGSVFLTVIEYILPNDVLFMTPDELRRLAGGR